MQVWIQTFRKDAHAAWLIHEVASRDVTFDVARAEVQAL